MKSVSIIFCIVLLYVNASEISLPLKNALFELGEKASTFAWGSTFHSLIEMSLYQGGQTKTEEVVAKIAKLRDQLIADQSNSDSEYAQRSSSLEEDIRVLEASLESKSNELRLTNQLLMDIDTDLVNSLNTKSNIQSQLSQLNGKEDALRQGKDIDDENLRRQVISSNRIIDALNQIIGMLSEAVFSQEGRSTVLTQVQKKNVVDRLRQELGQDNAMAMLVALTTKFDVPTVTKIIERLEQLRDSIQNQLIKDEAAAIQADIRFNAVIQQILEVTARLSSDFQSLLAYIIRKQNDRAQASSLINQLSIDVPITSHILASTKDELESTGSNYEARRHQRSQEIQIINSAYKLITSAQSQIAQGEADYQQENSE